MREGEGQTRSIGTNIVTLALEGKGVINETRALIKTHKCMKNCNGQTHDGHGGGHQGSMTRTCERTHTRKLLPRCSSR